MAFMRATDMISLRYGEEGIADLNLLTLHVMLAQIQKNQMFLAEDPDYYYYYSHCYRPRIKHIMT